MCNLQFLSLARETENCFPLLRELMNLLQFLQHAEKLQYLSNLTSCWEKFMSTNCPHRPPGRCRLKKSWSTQECLCRL